MRMLLAAGGPAALLVAGLVVACDKSPARPASLGPANTLRALQIEISGPSSIPPGQTAQFTARAQYTDGAERDVTDHAVWDTSDQSVLSVSPGGRAIGIGIGEAQIRVAVHPAFATKEVIVVPAGTFRLAGVVSEAGTPAEPVEDAHVQVTARGSTFSTATGEDGRYRLYGVVGESEVRVTREGYEPHVESVLVNDHRTLNIPLILTRPRHDVSGSYRLTIAASGECSGLLPEEVRRRTYTATLAQTGSRVEATLSDARFVLLKGRVGNRLRGTVEAATVNFLLTAHDWYYKGYGLPYGDLVEEIVPGSMYLVVDGSARVAVGPTGLTGSLNGSFHVFDGDPRWGPRRVARCEAHDHQFVLSR